MKINKIINIEFFVIIFFIFISLLQLLFIIKTHMFIGDFFPWKVNVPNETIFIAFTSQIFLYFFAYKFYKYFIRDKHFFKANLKLNKRIYIFIDYFFISLLILNIFFFLKGYINTTGTYKVNEFSFIIHIFSIDALFPIYYFLNRGKTNNFFYLLNICIYILFDIFEGNTSIILNVFIYELYFVTNQKIKTKYLFLIPITLIAGIFLYQIVYPLKFAIRNHLNILNIIPIPFIMSSQFLIGRLSSFGNFIAIIQYKNKLLTLFNRILPLNFEILKFIRMQIPSFISTKIFPKSIFFHDIGYVLWILRIGYMPNGVTHPTSLAPTLLGTLYLLFLRNPLELILTVLFTFCVIFYIKIILDTFGNKNVFFPFYFIIIQFINETGTVSGAFGELFFSITSFFLVLLFFKALTSPFLIKKID